MLIADSSTSVSVASLPPALGGGVVADQQVLAQSYWDATAAARESLDGFTADALLEEALEVRGGTADLAQAVRAVVRQHMVSLADWTEQLRRLGEEVRNLCPGEVPGWLREIGRAEEVALQEAADVLRRAVVARLFGSDWPALQGMDRWWDEVPQPAGAGRGLGLGRLLAEA